MPAHTRHKEKDSNVHVRHWRSFTTSVGSAKNSNEATSRLPDQARSPAVIHGYLCASRQECPVFRSQNPRFSVTKPPFFGHSRFPKKSMISRTYLLFEKWIYYLSISNLLGATCHRAAVTGFLPTVQDFRPVFLRQEMGMDTPMKRDATKHSDSHPAPHPSPKSPTA